MNSRIILSTLAGSVAAFVGSAILYGLLYNAVMKAEIHHLDVMQKPEEISSFVLFYICGLLWAWIYAYIFDKWAHLTSYMAGARAGAIISLVVTLSFDIGLYAMFDLFSPTYLMIDTLLGCVIGALVGGTIAMVQGRMTKSA